jgi:hypothetical protein
VVSNPHCGDHFSCTINLDQSMEAKIEWKLTWHCCICCNPAKGGWTLRTHNFITKDEMKACQLTRTELPHKKKKKKTNWTIWFLRQAHVVCHQLGFAKALQETHSLLVSGSFSWMQTTCHGSESSLDQCAHQNLNRCVVLENNHYHFGELSAKIN